MRDLEKILGKFCELGLYGAPDVLIYWRDYAAIRGMSFAEASGLLDNGSRGDCGGSVYLLHSRAKYIAELQADDRMWTVT